MNVGSLFAGIGGFDLGFERAGMRTVWQVEQDAYCRAVLERHFPDAERFEDVREVGATELEPVDLICGGFPCQDLSGAGKGAGLDGERSGLWFDFARIIRELRPRYVCVENVPDLLAGRGRRWPVAPISRVLGDLSEAGYDAEWAVLSAKEFGAPHLRERVWIVAYPGGEWPLADPGRVGGPTGGEAGHVARSKGATEGDGEQRQRGWDAVDDRGPTLADPDGIGWQGWSRYFGTLGWPESQDGGPDVADSDQDGRGKGLRQRSGQDERPRAGDSERGGEHLQDPDELALQPWRIGGRAAQAGGAEWWSVEPPLGRVAHGVPDRLDRLAALGNALVPQIAQWLGERIMTFESEQLMSHLQASKAEEVGA